MAPTLLKSNEHFHISNRNKFQVQQGLFNMGMSEGQLRDTEEP